MVEVGALEPSPTRHQAALTRRMDDLIIAGEAGLPGRENARLTQMIVQHFLERRHPNVLCSSLPLEQRSQ